MDINGLLCDCVKMGIDINIMFDQRLSELRRILTNEEYKQREEELCYLRRRVNEIMGKVF